jgi:hypothetical protein
MMPTKEWLVTADGRYIPLTGPLALLIDIKATIEDVAVVMAELDQVWQQSRDIVAASRRSRRLRCSGLRLVSS